MATGKIKNVLLQELSSSTKDQDGLKIYQLKSKVKWKDEENKIQVLTIGHENNAPIKCLLLVGETGAGKTKLINAFINHIFGIHFEDSFRIQLKDQLAGHTESNRLHHCLHNISSRRDAVSEQFYVH